MTDALYDIHLTSLPLLSKGKVRHNTIHAFKGLDAPAVIVTDVDEPSVAGFEALLYIGLTRPTDRLSVLATKEALASKVLDREGQR